MQYSQPKALDLCQRLLNVSLVEIIEYDPRDINCSTMVLSKLIQSTGAKSPMTPSGRRCKRKQFLTHSSKTGRVISSKLSTITEEIRHIDNTLKMY